MLEGALNDQRGVKESERDSLLLSILVHRLNVEILHRQRVFVGNSRPSDEELLWLRWWGGVSRVGYDGK